jgi:hypothetical protein
MTSCSNRLCERVADVMMLATATPIASAQVNRQFNWRPST